MGKKLFVGGLAKSISEVQLREHLEPFGELDEVKVVYDRETGQSRGFAFVTFFNDSEADEAIEALNGQELEGYRLNVNEARPREESGGPRRNFPPRRDNRFSSKGGGGKGSRKGRRGGQRY